ncbi:radical SAM protein [Acidocella sp. MX-AZ03]|uniref:radical SAM protein n=1 Tax=Acidocella sp. MX-AZ03 TaxID=2697363 RepID=UPI0022DE6042|nr:radical SAM protein [Acidocella sp. MX-AZ03]WBO60925.1 radical SAM protein [Acidocella sp. MX-AZ03]
MTHADLIARYDGRVPRYTSYPTAPHFSAEIGAAHYQRWLAALPEASPLSLYLHVPFCDRLCLYCGCHTSVARHERPKRIYAEALAREIGLLADILGRRARVSQIHWGGGTPTALPDDCLTSLMALLRTRFDVAADAEIAIEIDPVALSPDKLATLGRMGINRASLGVQDFDEAVQAAIGRPQSFAQTQDAAQGLRALGVTSLNLDLIYGLPLQTEASVARTARLALALSPDRVAVFGYAHVPWMKKHQALIPRPPCLTRSRACTRKPRSGTCSNRRVGCCPSASIITPGPRTRWPRPCGPARCNAASRDIWSMPRRSCSGLAPAPLVRYLGLCADPAAHSRLRGSRLQRPPADRTRLRSAAR